MKQPKQPIIDDKGFIDYVSEEITEFLIENNLELYKAEKDENFEYCSDIKELLMVFINDTSRILSLETGVSRQKLYQHFHSQNEYVHSLIRDEYENIKR